MSLLKSIANIWEADATLGETTLFTGKIPSTRLYAFPYVSVLATGGSVLARTSASAYSYMTVSFHIWLDEADLSTGEEIAEAIEDAFCERTWVLGNGRKVLDCLDEGRALENQVELPTRKYWEVVKLVTLLVERTRVSHPECGLEQDAPVDCGL